MKKILVILLVLVFTINTTNAWIGLIAQNWDLLNISKWNEMIDKLNLKIERNNIIAWNNIVLTNSGANDLIIDSNWSPREIPFITTTTQIVVQKNIQSVITINGTNFLPNSEVIIDGFDGTIDNTIITLWNSIELTITPWNNVSEYKIIISNDWTKSLLWPWNGDNLLKVIN